MEAGSERTKSRRTGQRPFKGLSKMQKANRLKAQTFESNPEMGKQVFSTVKTDTKGAIFHRDCNRAFTG
jgi:hypothetical protein